MTERPQPELFLKVSPALRIFLPARRRGGELLPVPHDGTSPLVQIVQSAGVPLTEVGALVVEDGGGDGAGRRVAPSYRPGAGETVRVEPVPRPQPVPGGPPRFLLDVHLGTLARRLRLVAGLDTAYHNDRDDAALVEQANAERRVLLSQDRGLLMRRRLWLGAYVHGSDPDDQLADVLDRFAPPLSPWTRCTACNGVLAAVGKAEVAHLLRPGTRRTYDTFARCRDCGRVYWRGAHGDRLESLVAGAAEAAGTPRSAGED
ncbi:Mut7-C RNAse domain-containing protein [Streptomyces sp. TRM 70361]|uniref:Mut7-C RNAse domain-containing protein n=1 Tax=Streptomyces sp. TRM 70361 TaxID=3116553 RepID=UPI002E7B8774|nr:Mut7-C RNAse domain-containing protein [Streptomyces sp. TRM 70361]MEE1939598.1 Mut7-C RNAse domain-containing protein [Streptomyces sp. TRM 70361]